MGKKAIPTSSEHTDPELVLQWQAGNERAFDTLYLRYVAGLVKEAATKTGSEETGKELVQELFIDVFLKKDALHPETSLYGYLHTALKHKILNHYRLQLVREKYRTQLLGSTTEPIGSDVFISYELKEKYKQIQQIIKNLPPQCRTIFLLSREEHLSHKEIATLLNISVNTVEQQIRKALKRLKENRGYLFLLLLTW